MDSGSTVKHCTMELGGNDPAVVLDDANLSKSVAGVLKAAFFGSGQIC